MQSLNRMVAMLKNEQHDQLITRSGAEHDKRMDALTEVTERTTAFQRGLLSLRQAASAGITAGDQSVSREQVDLVRSLGRIGEEWVYLGGEANTASGPARSFLYFMDSTGAVARASVIGEDSLAIGTSSSQEIGVQTAAPGSLKSTLSRFAHQMEAQARAKGIEFKEFYENQGRAGRVGR